MFRYRLAVAAVGLPLLASVVLLPERLFAVAVTLVLALAAAEFLIACPRAFSAPTVVAAAVVTAVLAATLRTVEGVPDWWPLALLAITGLALVVLLWPVSSDVTPAGAWWLGAVLYVGVLGAHFLMLRAGPQWDGQRWVVVLLAVTFATDTGAYLTGRTVGRHILWAAVSPSKTWEGFAGGMLLGALAVVALPILLGIAPAPLVLAGMAVALPFLAICGDFLESALKRRMDVKDMSNVLPGHGGLLDRMDSLLLVGPGLYWFLQWVHPPLV